MRPVQVETQEQVEEARSLFLEYERSLGVDLCFQGFEEELAELPGRYAPPDGRLFLLRVPEGTGEVTAGCAALRRHDARSCEMKRLHVRESHRGFGLGRAAALVLIEAAEDIGYDRMILDTLQQMRVAQALYSSLGFTQVAPYYDNPESGAIFMELALPRPRSLRHGSRDGDSQPEPTRAADS